LAVEIGHNGSVKHGYRMRMSPLRRYVRVALFVICGLILLGGALSNDAVVWRLLSGVGVIASALAIRIVLGPIIVVKPKELVIQRNWPIRRRIVWYRIDHVEVIPGFWTILVELNSGERFELPCVDPVDDLYEQLELHRKALDNV
jgi:hypothetical protein